MRIYLSLILLLFTINVSFSQKIIDLSGRDIHAKQMLIPDNNTDMVVDTSKIVRIIREVNVKVTPPDANDAFVTLIQIGRVETHEDYEAIDDIAPDTLGKWKAPFILKLPQGIYNFVATKDGFREELIKLEVNDKEEYDATLKLYTLDYLKYNREKWNKIKWISAAVAAGAGLAVIYFNSRVNTLQDEYNNASTPDVILDKRNSINKNQSLYRVSSGIGFAAVGCFGLSWAIELSY